MLHSLMSCSVQSHEEMNARAGFCSQDGMASGIQQKCKKLHHGLRFLRIIAVIFWVQDLHGNAAKPGQDATVMHIVLTQV